MEFFGQSIDASGRGSLRDQVRSILEKEIRAGRWRVGERLPTVREMAKAAGLSTSPVHQAVSALVQEGYLEKHVGRGTFLRSSKTNSRPRTGVIGIVLGAQRPGIEVPTRLAYFHNLIEAACQEFPRHGFTTSIFHEQSLCRSERVDPDHLISTEALRKVDGVLNIRFVLDSLIELVRGLEIPMVCLSTVRTPPGVPFVAADDQQAMWDAVDVLYQKGHRKIGLVHAFGPDLKPRGVRARYDAFFEATADLGIPARKEWIVDVGPSDNIQVLPLKAFLMGANLPTAVICTQSEAAKALYDVAAMMGKRIGGDLSVVGMTDEAQFGRDFDPPVSTFVTPTAVLAQHAAQALADMIKSRQGPTASGILVRPVWTPRNSVATIGSEKPRPAGQRR